jgi:hypothetical protein
VFAIGLSVLLALTGYWRLAGFAWAMLAGQFLEGSRRRGIWALGDAVELRTLVSSTRISFDHIVCLHVAPHASGVAVETATGTYLMGVSSGADAERAAADSQVIIELGARHGFEVRDYSDAMAYVNATPRSRPAGWSIDGARRAVSSPDVWATVLVYALVAIPVVLTT